jgi:hypothetical protein
LRKTAFRPEKSSGLFSFSCCWKELRIMGMCFEFLFLDDYG